MKVPAEGNGAAAAQAAPLKSARRFLGRSDGRSLVAGAVFEISAIQAALDKVALGLLDDHARHCVIEGGANGEPEELTEELMGAVGRLLRRG